MDTHSTSSNQGCSRFPIMLEPGAWEIANSIKMFKTGPQMDNNNNNNNNNNNAVFNCQQLQTCKTK